MQTVVTMGVAAGSCTVLLYQREQTLMFARLGDECNHSSGPSTYRTTCARLPSVAFGTIGLFKVDVRVDSTGCDVSSFSIQNLRRGIGRKPAADAGDFAIFDTNLLAFDDVRCVTLD